jgi:hypothetical protein
MGIFSRIFGRNKPAEKAGDEKGISAEEDEWAPVPAFVPLTRDKWGIPAAITVAIAAQDRPSSSFSVRSVEVANPEACRVIAIVAACAAQNCPSSAFSLRSVSCRKSVQEVPHAS